MAKCDSFFSPLKMWLLLPSLSKKKAIVHIHIGYYYFSPMKKAFRFHTIWRFFHFAFVFLGEKLCNVNTFKKKHCNKYNDFWKKNSSKFDFFFFFFFFFWQTLAKSAFGWLASALQPKFVYIYSAHIYGAHLQETSFFDLIGNFFVKFWRICFLV
jgi:hypothetical protein